MSSPEQATASGETIGNRTSSGQPDPLSVLVVVPTYNGGALWAEAAGALARSQSVSRHYVRVKIVDSASSDNSAETALRHGFQLEAISSADFDHGGTRNAAVRGDCADIYMFLTQDAVVACPTALDTLLAAFADPQVAVAYGRQLPHRDANPIAAHARIFNYGPKSRVAGLEDREELGIKTVFASNSFAAYRASVFNGLGGFPERNILSEDMYFAARAVLSGGKVAYVADACVRHSHNYSPAQEFRRYFDIGVFQSDQPWIGRRFGRAEGEGMRFVRSEARYLLAKAPLWLPRALLHNVLKLLGYRLGRRYKSMPLAWCRYLSLQPGYWRVHLGASRNTSS